MTKCKHTDCWWTELLVQMGTASKSEKDLSNGGTWRDKRQINLSVKSSVSANVKDLA